MESASTPYRGLYIGPGNWYNWMKINIIRSTLTRRSFMNTAISAAIDVYRLETYKHLGVYVYLMMNHDI